MLLEKLVLSVFKINATLQSYIFKSDLSNTLSNFEYQLIFLCAKCISFFKYMALVLTFHHAMQCHTYILA